LQERQLALLYNTYNRFRTWSVEVGPDKASPSGSTSNIVAARTQDETEVVHLTIVTQLHCDCYFLFPDVAWLILAGKTPSFLRVVGGAQGEEGKHFYLWCLHQAHHKCLVSNTNGCFTMTSQADTVKMEDLTEVAALDFAEYSRSKNRQASYVLASLQVWLLCRHAQADFYLSSVVL
jgi:hypothetical protein